MKPETKWRLQGWVLLSWCGTYTVLVVVVVWDHSGPWTWLRWLCAAVGFCSGAFVLRELIRDRRERNRS